MPPLYGKLYVCATEKVGNYITVRGKVKIYEKLWGSNTSELYNTSEVCVRMYLYGG